MVFNESEIPCFKNKIDNHKEKTKESTSQFEVKLARLGHTQPENVEYDVEQSDENIVNTDEDEIEVPQVEVETDIGNTNNPTNETDI